MRFSDDIVLVNKIAGEYNSTTGKNDPAIEVEKRFECNISKMGRERAATEFGTVDTKIMIAIFQNPLDVFYTEAYVNGSKKKCIVRSDSNFKKGVLFLEG